MEERSPRDLAPREIGRGEQDHDPCAAARDVQGFTFKMMSSEPGCSLDSVSVRMVTASSTFSYRDDKP